MSIQFFIDVMILAFKALTERRLRASLTIIGIAIGPLALVMISSVVDGYADYIFNQIQRLGQNTIVLFPASGYRFTENDLNILRSIEGISRSEPFYSIQASVKIEGEDKIVFVYALPIDVIFQAFGGLEVLEGSIPSESQYSYAVIGYKLAFKDNRKVNDIGDVITLTFIRTEGGRSVVRRATISISAILNEFGGAFILSPDTTVFLPLDAGKKLLGLSEWSGILIISRSSEDVPRIVKILQEIYKNSADVISFQGIANIANSITNAVSFISFAASLSAFAVAVAGVAATMITSVIERTRELGVLKAMGFTNTQVLIMILMESIVMSIIGGLIGMSLGILGAHLLAQQGFTIRASAEAIIAVRAPPKITIDNILKTLSLTLFVGVAGGIFPAYRASKIPPAVALRYE